MRRPLSALAALLVASALAAPALRADEDTPFGTFVYAKALKRRNPSYPAEAQWQWKEGWVLVSMCVDAQGAVRDPVIERSSGSKEFEREALRVLPRWQYEPARLNGEPVEQCSMQVRLTFSIRGPKGARPQFVREWKKAQALLDAGDVSGAEALFEALKPENNYEGARLLLAKSQVANLRGDRVADLAALCAALGFSDHLEKDLRTNVKRKVFALQLTLKEYASAISTYDDLADEASELLSEAERSAGSRLEAAVAGDSTLASNGELSCRCDEENGPPLWSARLLRREFGFADARGKIDRFELRCARHRFAAPFAAATAWKVPEAWGACTLFVYGEQGATFRLLEYPTAVAEEPAPAVESLEEKS